MTGRELIEWIRKNHAEDMIVHIRNTDGREVEGEDPEVTVSVVEGRDGQLRSDRYIMI